MQSWQMPSVHTQVFGSPDTTSASVSLDRSGIAFSIEVEGQVPDAIGWPNKTVEVLNDPTGQRAGQPRPTAQLPTLASGTPETAITPSAQPRVSVAPADQASMIPIGVDVSTAEFGARVSQLSGPVAGGTAAAVPDGDEAATRNAPVTTYESALHFGSADQLDQNAARRTVLHDEPASPDVHGNQARPAQTDDPAGRAAQMPDAGRFDTADQSVGANRVPVTSPDASYPAVHLTDAGAIEVARAAEPDRRAETSSPRVTPLSVDPVSTSPSVSSGPAVPATASNRAAEITPLISAEGASDIDIPHEPIRAPVEPGPRLATVKSVAQSRPTAELLQANGQPHPVPDIGRDPTRADNDLASVSKTPLPHEGILSRAAVAPYHVPDASEAPVPPAGAPDGAGEGSVLVSPTAAADYEETARVKWQSGDRVSVDARAVADPRKDTVQRKSVAVAPVSNGAPAPANRSATLTPPDRGAVDRPTDIKTASVGQPEFRPAPPLQSVADPIAIEQMQTSPSSVRVSDASTKIAQPAAWHHFGDTGSTTPVIRSETPNVSAATPHPSSHAAKGETPEIVSQPVPSRDTPKVDPAAPSSRRDVAQSPPSILATVPTRSDPSQGLTSQELRVPDQTPSVDKNLATAKLVPDPRGPHPRHWAAAGTLAASEPVHGATSAEPAGAASADRQAMSRSEVAGSPPVAAGTVSPPLSMATLVPAAADFGRVASTEALTNEPTLAIVPTNAAGVDGIPSEARPATEPAIARQTALQIAEAARHLPDRPVEITLNPEELGRVRMTLSAADDAIVVTLAVERGETADLLRRHIETLAQEFRSLGYRDISFEFGGGHGGAGMDNPADQESQAKDQGSGIDPAPADPGPAPLRIDLGGRVDMRI